MIAVVGPPVTRDGARSAAEHELSKAIYHRNGDPWPIRVYRWLLHWIDHALQEVARHSPGGGLGALAIAVVAIALVLVARRQLGPMQRTRRASAQLQANPVLTASHYRQLATQAAQAQRWDEAVVAGMRALVRELEERGVLDMQPGRTADELARELASLRPELGGVARDAALAFDAVAYGGHSATASSYDVVRAADDGVRQQGRPALVP